MHLLSPALFLQVAVAHDTVLTRIVETELSTLEKILAFAQNGAVVLVYVLLAALVFAILKMAKTIEQAKDKLEDVRMDIRELIDNGNKIVAKTNSIVDTVKSSIDGVQETVDNA